MTTARGKIQYDVTAKTAKFTTAMNQVDGRLKGMQKSMSKLGAITGGVFAVGAVTSFISENIRLFKIQEQAQVKLLKALKDNKQGYEELRKQASALQKLTLFGDEQTLEAQAQLAALNLSVDAVKRLTPLVQDLATLMNMDLAAAAALVAKSVGSSTNALSRYGIQITGAVGSSERLKSAMDSIAQVAGGQAMAAALDTQTGKLIQLQNKWDDIRESLGLATLELINFIDMADPTGGMVKRLAEAQRILSSGEAGPTGKPSQALGIWVAMAEEVDEVTKGVSNLNSELEMIGLTGKMQQMGISRPSLEGFGLDMNAKKEAGEALSTIFAGFEELDEKIGSVGVQTETWQAGLWDVNSVVGAINSGLDLAGLKMDRIVKTLQILQQALNFSGLISSFLGLGAGFSLTKGIGTGIVNPGQVSPLKLRGADIKGAVDATNGIQTALGG